MFGVEKSQNRPWRLKSYTKHSENDPKPTGFSKTPKKAPGGLFWGENSFSTHSQNRKSPKSKKILLDTSFRYRFFTDLTLEIVQTSHEGQKSRCEASSETQIQTLRNRLKIDDFYVQNHEKSSNFDRFSYASVWAGIWSSPEWAGVFLWRKSSKFHRLRQEIIKICQ